MSHYRDLDFIQSAIAVTDGDGVKIQRNVVHKKIEKFDPFLLLDELKGDEAADYIGGFPEHPHRGFETVTYMLEGSMQHKDHLGNVGTLVPGSVQWMTAGRGVIHSEMPLQDDGKMHGFQLWVNLPAKDKMQPANYREFTPEEIPAYNFGAASTIKVIAGEVSVDSSVVKGPVKDIATQPDYFDLTMAPADHIDLPIKPENRVMVYVFQGQISVLSKGDNKTIAAQTLALSNPVQATESTLSLSVDATAERPVRLLVLSGKPIHEPIANYGPFVMNTREEIEQAMLDYRNGVLTG